MTAANPAARPYHATHTCDQTEERIRVLEARVKELDAMLYEMRSQRDYAIAIQEDRER